MLKKVIGSIALALVLAACSPQEAHKPVTQAHPHHNMVMHEYREHSENSNDWIYWYVLYSNSTSSPSSTAPSTTSGSTPQYYYRSTTPVTNFSSTQFTRVNGGALPKDVKEEVDKSEETAEHEMTNTEEPADVAQTEALEASVEAAAAGGSGGREEQAENSQNESQSESTSAESSSSSDSGSSGGDSGGGGGDGGGE